MPLPLDRPDLLRGANRIAGRWIEAGGDGIPVTNPATGETLAHVPRSGRAQAAEAIAAAEDAMPQWAALTAKARATVLRRWFEAIMANQADLAAIMTAEQGKPLAESMGEIAYAASFIEWFAEEGKRAYGDVIPAHAADRRILVLKQPVGVAAAITPWNFPAAMITRKAGPALAAGCPMVVKPATATPLSAIALAILAEEAGLDPRLLSVITGSASAIAAEFTSNPAVRKLSFTGSTEIGKQLYAAAAQNVQKISLELGGNAPFIVLDDADLDAAVEGAIQSKFRNAGQTCVCANRIYAQSGIHDAFVEKLAARIARLKIGNGAEPGVDIGPLIDMAAVEKTEEHIADAVSKGAKLVGGGERQGGTFLSPALLTGVTAEMAVATEETFGPLAPVFRFETDEEAIAAANATRFGLAAYFYGQNLGRVVRLAERLEYGIVGINSGLISTEVAPFGGIKESGIGREGSRYGLDEYLETKYLCIGI
ncbi:NAD-dependent succinate-semialdehyde dehydrogenase [Sandaracinobacter sp. RS1-74]|uniref:NAD-dependent succinate-semialdehyde dehydrogenase n=1 Tax=Sandaracinobacteroides sayramensis TaxID=2913411 RepID=UPI001EDAB89D|nr:NAD-dependent succinate-semialdehyde dehydrogenase [Sandaracinobacteroides sayramensis]MCG2839787.1 NAD-dependent succinate-semialdehyde dehydrogenase [Sandaracinobacteroides sayramensis]